MDTYSASTFERAPSPIPEKSDRQSCSEGYRYRRGTAQTVLKEPRAADPINAAGMRGQLQCVTYTDVEPVREFEVLKGYKVPTQSHLPYRLGLSISIVIRP